VRKTPLKRSTPLRSSSSPQRTKKINKVNWARLDKRTKAYRAYLASDAWQGRRQVALQAADYHCARCGWTPFHEGATCSVEALLRANGLHVHHTTYARFGHELPDDLEVLCESCHEKEHAGRFIRPRGLRTGAKS